MMDSGNLDFVLAKESKFGKMEVYMRDIGKITRPLVKED